MLSTKGSAALQVNQIRAGAALSYVSMALSTVISLVYTPIMLRQLGDSEFGVYQAVLPIISYLNLLSFGLGSAYVRYYSRFRAAGDKKGCAKLNGMFLITYLILGALVLAIGFGLSYCDVVFGKKLTAEEIDLAQRLLRIMSVNAALTFPISVFESHVTINERYLFQKIVAMGKQVLNPLIMIPLLLIGYRSVTLTIVSLIFTVLSGVINITYCLTRLKMPFAFRHYDFALLREMFGFTLYVFIGIVVDNINWSIDRQLLTWFHGSAAVTVYVIASQLNNYFLLFGNAISNVMTPRVHRLVAENAPMRTLDALFTKVGRLQFILLGGIFLGFVAIGQSFVVLWGGGEQFRIDYWTALLLVLALLLGCTGCGEKQEPVTVTIWHVYGGETESPLNDLIDTFNETVGRAQNIRVQVGSVTNTNTIHEAVLASAYGEPGATALPDMFVSYPKTVLALPDADILVDYRDYFSDAELDDFIPAFLAEGEIGGHLTVLPVAKSTEILFVDKTLFDRFAAATGATLDDLSTWEGLYRTAEAYTAWTDAQTPDTPDDGKVFFVHDYHFNYFQVGVESLGTDFFDGDQVAFGPVFRRVWEPYARATLAGSVWLKSGYATEPLRTGDAVASVASSASVLYYANTVTYPDNTSEPVEIISLPCPTFAGGEKLVMQRGAGICTVRSTPERERACMTFLKWLTAPKRNVDFVTRLGYMPVSQTAFADELPSAVRTLDDPMYVSLYQAYLDTQSSYTFYTPPQRRDYLELETRFEEQVRLQLTAGRVLCEQQGGGAREALIWSTLDQFEKNYVR